MLLDLVMPGMDGFQVCQHIKDDPNTRSIRVIAMTGHVDRGYEQRIIDAGAEVCVTKPFEIEDLLKFVGLGSPTTSAGKLR